MTAIDVLGREVATLVQGTIQAGEHTVVWNAQNVPSGIYFYRLEASGIGDPSREMAQVKEMILLR